VPERRGSGRRPAYWTRACAELSRRDPVMARLVREFRGSVLRGGGDAFETLCRAVVGQQISLQAADSVWRNLLAHFGDEMMPHRIHRCHLGTLRRCGLSQNKARCLKNIAQFFVHRRVTPRYWRRPLDETRAALLSITGIGPWTFEMFAIFYLKHPDVLPLGDLGLVNAMEQQYNDGRRLAAARLRTIAARWEPWRTVATWYLWRSIDPEPVVYPGPAADA